MGEERIWTELNQVKKDVKGIQTDVTSVKTSMGRIETALLGDEFGNQGYGERIGHLEEVCEEVDDEIKKSKTYRYIAQWIFLALVGSGGTFSIIKFLIPLFK
jgi:hypothetical protein